MLYEMLLGDHPFAVGSVSLVLKAQLFKVPPAPHLVDSSVPEALSLVIMKSIEKVADDRFATAEEMRQALLLASQGTPLPASLAPAKPVGAPLLDLAPTVAVSSEQTPPKLMLTGEKDTPTVAKPLPTHVAVIPSVRLNDKEVEPLVKAEPLPQPEAEQPKEETVLKLETPPPAKPESETIVERKEPPSNILPKVLVGTVLLIVVAGGVLSLNSNPGIGVTPTASPLAAAPPPTPTASLEPSPTASIQPSPTVSVQPSPTASLLPSAAPSATPTPESAVATITLHPNPTDPHILIDGNQSVRAGDIVTLTPGKRHSIKVTSKDYQPAFQNVTLTPGQKTEIPIDLTKLAKTPPVVQQMVHHDTSGGVHYGGSHGGGGRTGGSHSGGGHTGAGHPTGKTGVHRDD
jgi:hypothetical protein